MSRQSTPQDYVAIILAAFFYGLVTVSGKYFADAGFSLYEISLLIMFTPLILLPVLILRRELRISKQHLRFFVGFGLVGALLQLTQFTGIVLGVPVAIVALLLYTQPIWTTLLGRMLLQEDISKAKILAGGLALMGIVVLVWPFEESIHLSVAGIAGALLAGVFLSLWVIFGRKSGIKDQHFLVTTFGYTFFSAVWLLALYPLIAFVLPEPTLTRLDFKVYLVYWLAILAFSIFVSLTPNFLAFRGLRRVEASTAGILLLFEPVSAALFAYLWFGQSLSFNVWIGGVFILLGNFVLLRDEQLARYPSAAKPHCET